jgi:hypothetical protein
MMVQLITAAAINALAAGPTPPTSLTTYDAAVARDAIRTVTVRCPHGGSASLKIVARPGQRLEISFTGDRVYKDASRALTDAAAKIAFIEQADVRCGQNRDFEVIISGQQSFVATTPPTSKVSFSAAISSDRVYIP